MTLTELCEPVFLEVCRLNRLGRILSGGNTEVNSSRAEVVRMLEQVKTRASTDVTLSGQYQKVERPLVYFIDWMVINSSLPWAYDWNPLSVELWNEGDFGDRFWDLLEETLAENSAAATERLEVFYTCVGLGFTGRYLGQQPVLRRKMLEIQARVSGRGRAAATRFLEEQELHVDRRKLFEPPTQWLTVLTILFVGLLAIVLVCNYVLYNAGRSDLRSSLRSLSESTQKGAVARNAAESKETGQ